MNQIIDLLKRLESDKFFGSVELKFEAGRIVLARKIENFKPTSDLRSARGNNEQTQR